MTKEETSSTYFKKAAYSTGFSLAAAAAAALNAGFMILKSAGAVSTAGNDIPLLAATALFGTAVTIFSGHSAVTDFGKGVQKAAQEAQQEKPKTQPS